MARSLIATYKALGGGWEYRYGIRRTPAPTPVLEEDALEEDELPPVPPEANLDNGLFAL